MSFIVFDTEDDSKEIGARIQAGDKSASFFKKRVTQIAAIKRDGTRFYNQGNQQEFLAWLERQEERYIYSLNIQYDCGNLFSKKLDVLDSTLVGGRVIKSIYGDKIFVDVFNIWPMSVEKLGKAFGLEKLKTESMATDKKYVFRDCEIILKAMEFAWQFCELLDIENLCPTLGGLCVKIWKHWGGVNCHDSTKICRESLYGGRVELFKKVNDSERVCWTDINSLYPAVMRGLFPERIDCYEPELSTLAKLKHGVARVTVQVPKCEIAPLPYREEKTGRILYPWGKFTGCWVLPELKAALAQGTKIVKLYDLWGTNEESRPYVTFVETLYDARLKAKTDAEKLFFKLLMNNLYGRLGTTGVIGRTVHLTEKTKNLGVEFGERTLVNYQMPLSEETNWLHAAYVTAYGRLELLKYLRLIGAERLIYCDTDSTIFDCPSLGGGRNNSSAIPFPIGNQLGQMKLESWESACETFAPKMYRIGKTYKAKGVPKRLQEEFIRTGSARFELPFKMRESIRFFNERRNNAGKVTFKANSRELSVWHEVTKKQRGTYDKKRAENNRYFPLQLARA